MNQKTVNKRYLGAMMGSGGAYIASVFGVSFLEDSVIDGSVAGIATALVPGVFIFGMIWALWRFMRETDEVTRHYHTEAMQIGLYVILVMSGAWGLVEVV